MPRNSLDEPFSLACTVLLAPKQNRSILAAYNRTAGSNEPSTSNVQYNPIAFPPIPTPDQRAIEISATSLPQKGPTRASSAMTTARRTVNVKPRAKNRQIILNQNAAL